MWINKEELDDLVSENRTLRQENEALKKQNQEMRWQMSGDKNHVMVAEAEKAYKKYHQVLMANAELTAEVSRLTLERDFYFKVIRNSRRLAAEYAENALPEAQNCEESAENAGLFNTRNDNKTTKDVQIEAFLLAESGNTDKQIAEILQINASSVPAYRSKGKKLYLTQPIIVENNTNGRIRRKEVPKNEIEDGCWIKDTGWRVVRSEF